MWSELEGGVGGVAKMSVHIASLSAGLGLESRRAVFVGAIVITSILAFADLEVLPHC